MLFLISTPSLPIEYILQTKIMTSLTALCDNGLNTPAFKFTVELTMKKIENKLPKEVQFPLFLLQLLTY